MDEIDPPLIVPDQSEVGAGYSGMNADQALSVFNSTLNAWLKHDIVSMQTSQPMAYQRNQTMAAPTVQTQQNRQMLFILGLVGLVFFVIAEEKK